MRSRPSSAGSRPPIATPRCSPPTRSIARSPRLTGSGSPLADRPADGERVLVALSGGVDSAVAALREREAGRDVVAVTLKLWADQRTDGEKSCCSPEAVLGARRVAHSLGNPAPDARPGAGVPGRGGGPVPARLRGGPHAEPLRALQRRAAHRRDDRPGRPPRRLEARHRPLRAHRRRRVGSAAGRRGGWGQGPDLHALRACAAVPRAAALSARRSDQAGGPGARRATPASRLPAVPRARTSASSPARGSASSCGATPGSRIGRVRWSTARAAGSESTTAITTSPSASGAGSAVGGGEPLYVLATDAAANRVVAGARDELATRRVRIRDARLHRPAERVDGVRLRYHSPRRGSAGLR